MTRRWRSTFAIFWLPLLTAGAHACSDHTTAHVGRFTMSSTRAEFGGHSSTHTQLSFDRRKLSDRLSDITIDPARQARIVYASQAPVCGTFFFDGDSGASWQLSSGVMVVHAASQDSPVDAAGASPWSPDGRFVYVGNDVGTPLVVDLRTRAVLDLTRAMSAQGRRVDARATVWASGSRKLAVEIAADGYNGGRDLAAVTIEPFGDVEYIASMSGPLPLWTTRDYGWVGDELVARDAGVNGPIAVQPVGSRRWQTLPPDASPVGSDERRACD